MRNKRKTQRALTGTPQETTIQATRAGDWVPTAELLATAIAAVAAGGDLTCSLKDAAHLETSGLQILLALSEEQQHRGRKLRFVDVSPSLAAWFAYAGAERTLLQSGTGSGNVL